MGTQAPRSLRARGPDFSAGASSAGRPPTTHNIARRYVYPGMTIGRGSEWKSSAERRRTQRLIDEAFALMRGGYRTLLRG